MTGRGERIVLAVIGGGALLFLVAPMLIVALASLDPSDFFTFPPESVSDRWYSEFLGDDSWRSSIVLTLTIAALTGVLSTIIGALAGIAVARSSTVLRRVLYVALIAPLTVPVIVLAISYYGIALDLKLVGSLAGFVLANTLLTAPLVALFVAASAAGVDPRLEYASLSCGAGPWRTITRVTLPLVAPTAIAGGALAFLLSLDEVVMSLFLVAPGRTPLAVKMFLQVQTGTAPIVTAAATFLIAASILVVGALTLVRSLRGDGGALAVPADMNAGT